MSLATLSEKCFLDFKEFVHKLTGIELIENKKVMLAGRLRKRARELKCDSFEAYFDYLKKNKEEEKFLTIAVTTNETYFYRTPRVWDYFENEYLPHFFESGGRQLNVWSAASSTGDEAHTIGIVCENFKTSHSGFDYKVIGTDISSRVVDVAIEGLYVGRPVRRFKEARSDLFEKYMVGDDENGYQVIHQVKSKISFSIHNLFSTYRGGRKFDLVFLRNVLIYFSKNDQEKVLQNIAQTLNPNGILIIGESESLNRINTSFTSVKPFIYSLGRDNAYKGAA